MNLDNFEDLFDKNTLEVDEIKQLISKYFTRKYVSKEEKNVFFERLIGHFNPEKKKMPAEINKNREITNFLLIIRKFIIGELS